MKTIFWNFSFGKIFNCFWIFHFDHFFWKTDIFNYIYLLNDQNDVIKAKKVKLGWTYTNAWPADSRLVKNLQSVLRNFIFEYAIIFACDANFWPLKVVSDPNLFKRISAWDWLNVSQPQIVKSPEILSLDSSL